ncbi:MAG: gephyrin-like molybdotransferase Glp [Planctomycetota bacterium]
MSAAGVYVTIEEAQRIVLDHTKPGRPITISLAEALGRTLAEAVRCDMDYPPFDRAMMDGYAVRACDVANAPVTLRVVGQIAAGVSPSAAVGPAQAMQINTGAPMPSGADAVVPVEATDPDQGGAAVLIKAPVKLKQHVAFRGEYVRQGQVVPEAGQRMGPGQIGVAGSAGAHHVRVYPPPVVAVLSTGDELVGVDQVPRGAQIRNSNSGVLEALITHAGGRAVNLGNVPDDRTRTEAKIREGLQADVLCVTGGISMGTFDLVPGVLADCGVRFLVHKLAIKPGRPTIFGVHADGPLVFGLPGNPVSTFVGFWLLVRPALAAMQGRVGERPRLLAARLRGAFKAPGERQSYWPARMQVDESGALTAEALPWGGSGDPFGLACADGLIVRPAGAPSAEEGETVRVMLLEPL